MNISQAARASGLTAKTIRYYESIDLVASPKRGSNGYRYYQPSDVETLRFIQHAREASFSIEECRELLGFYQNKSRRSKQVKSFVLAKVDALEEQIASLRRMQTTLSELANRCAGDELPDCAIIDSLSQDNRPFERENK